MTNLSKIKKMTKLELIELFHRLRKAPGFEYIDFDRWLSSSSEDFIFRGSPGVYKDHAGKEFDCMIVGSKTVFSKPYKTIMVGEQIMSVPKEQVRAAGKG